MSLALYPAVRQVLRARHFWPAYLVTVAALSAAGAYGGLRALTSVAVLGLLEVCVSFDNALVNARVLRRMSPGWQLVFTTVGVVVAAIGVRMVAPLLIVTLASREMPLDALGAALHEPHRYADMLEQAEPGIAGFGGTFLVLVFLAFVGEPREEPWIGAVEGPLGRLARVRLAAPAVAACVALAAALLVPSGRELEAVIGVVLGLAVYGLVEVLGGLAECASRASRAGRGGGAGGRREYAARWAGLLLFGYVEILDAAFSVDSVMGAFSLTFDVILIMLGLSIGAAYVRSMTVTAARGGSLLEVRYLEHGAYYAMGLLGVLLLAETRWNVPEPVTAALSAGVIGAAIICSRSGSKREQKSEP